MSDVMRQSGILKTTGCRGVEGVFDPAAAFTKVSAPFSPLQPRRRLRVLRTDRRFQFDECGGFCSLQVQSFDVSFGRRQSYGHLKCCCEENQL
jgi:hypothetical protein